MPERPHKPSGITVEIPGAATLYGGPLADGLNDALRN
jgi:hypothetical protein